MIPLIYKGEISSAYANRAGYYGVGGIPQSFVAGNIDTGTASYSSMEYYFNDLSDEESSLDFDLSYEADPENGLILSADVSLSSDLANGAKRIFFVLADFYNQAYFTTERDLDYQNFGLSSTGDSQVYNQSLSIHDECNFNDLKAIVFVQNVSTKEIYHAEQIDVNLNSAVTGTVSDDFTNEPLANVKVNFGSFSSMTNNQGEYQLNLIAGNYNVSAEIENYLSYSDNFVCDVAGDHQFDFSLNELLLPPNSLKAEWNNNDIELNWNNPGVLASSSFDFENNELPENWLSTQNEGEGWFVTNDGGSSGFSIPDHSTYFATNDDETNDDSSNDMLITNPVNLTGILHCDLRFQSYFTGMNTASANIKYSLDNGVTWQFLSEVLENDAWYEVVISLDEICGSNAESLRLAFHFDDNGGWSSGWAIDDVTIGTGETTRELLGFNLYQTDLTEPINDQIITENAYSLQNYPLLDYEFGVKAVYTSGESEFSNLFTLNQVTNEDTPEYKNKLSIYPNPFYLNSSHRGNITIVLETKNNEKPINATIYNCRGQKVTTITDFVSNSSNTHELYWNGKNTKNQQVTNGIYFVKVTTPNTETSKKILLIK
jgi:hypothetical protein